MQNSVRLHVDQNHFHWKAEILLYHLDHFDIIYGAYLEISLSIFDIVLRFFIYVLRNRTLLQGTCKYSFLSLRYEYYRNIYEVVELEELIFVMSRRLIRTFVAR